MLCLVNRAHGQYLTDPDTVRALIDAIQRCGGFRQMQRTSALPSPLQEVDSKNWHSFTEQGNKVVARSTAAIHAALFVKTLTIHYICDNARFAIWMERGNHIRGRCLCHVGL